jgi:hypothetical protein
VCVWLAIFFELFRGGSCAAAKEGTALHIYLLQHVHVLSIDPECEDIKIIGMYSTEEKALAAKERLSKQPGFTSAPDGFHIDKYEVDKDNWIEGYCTVFE